MQKHMFGLLLAGAVSASLASGVDPYLWLEDMASARTTAWVNQQNAISRTELEALPDFTPTRDALKKIFNSNDRIPYIEKVGNFYYNFWRDNNHVRGIWRRTTLAEYRKASPAWETVLDLDRLARDERENWVWQGATCERASGSRCLLSLSRGGADAAVIREFDLTTKTFAANGFSLPEAKGAAEWKDRDTLYVMTDFGQNSLTDSGYPRFVKEWKRGTPLASARTLFAGQRSDVTVHASVYRHKTYRYDMIERAVTFSDTEALLRRGSEWVRLGKPADATVAFFDSWILLQLKSDWTTGGKTWSSGSLIAAPVEDFLQGKRNFTALFVPTASTALDDVTSTRDGLLLTITNDVKASLEERTLMNGQWQSRKVATPTYGTLKITEVDREHSDEYFLTFTDFLTPTSLHLARTGSDTRESLKTLPAFFDSAPFRIQQFFAVSKDGTRVPYFIIGAKNLRTDGKNPTLLYGYG
ncbi:S9 family peptidase, partial [Paludibacterium paludis]